MDYKESWKRIKKYIVQTEKRLRESNADYWEIAKVRNLIENLENQNELNEE